MGDLYPRVIGSYRQQFTTGLTAGVAAASSTAGHICALRFATANQGIRLRRLEVEGILTTAFGAAQRVGFDAVIARGYTAAHTGATALTIATNDGKVSTTQSATPTLTGRIADTGALTAGTHTFDANPIAGASVYASAIGIIMPTRYYDFTTLPTRGFVLGNNEGVVIRNTISMGATGVFEWKFTFEWDQLDLT